MTTTHQRATTGGARAGSSGNRIRDHKRKVQAAARDELIRTMRAAGDSYQDIRDQLAVSARIVEDALGEVAELAAHGRTQGDIADLVGLPRATVQRLIRTGRDSRPNARHEQTARLIAEMYGMQADVLADFLGMEIGHVRSLARQLREDGLMLPKLIQVQPGEKWIVPTRDAASSFLGWEVHTTWRPPLKDAEHYRAVAMARALLVGMEPGAWISERQLRRDAELSAPRTRGRARYIGHIHDGRFLGVIEGHHGWYAVEVELTAKSASNMDKALQGAINAARHAEPDALAGVLYLCRGDDVVRVVEAANRRLPQNYADALVVVGDLDAEWQEFRKTRRQMRAATRSANPNHRRRRGVQKTGQDSDR
ncbi:hypothetical protein [Nocardia salmonicida]|uniref:hypothetical protein n=1 Tax=Nocardia salmonicida TaxID=53431 RepID=UPI0007A54D24|nr:hypothetical protein [Nocardia salmonicida]